MGSGLDNTLISLKKRHQRLGASVRRHYVSLAVTAHLIDPALTDRVDRYGDLMKDGEWLVSPDAIAFDYTGRLINGQHRLKAIGNSGETVTCLVVWNLPPEAFKIADVGVKRTGGDVLRIEGFKNPEELAAVCRLIALWKQSRLEECNQYENVENTTIVDIANACSPRIQELVKEANKCRTDGIHTAIPRSLTIFMRYAYEESFPEAIEEFYAGLVTKKEFKYRDWAEECGVGEGHEDYDDIENPVRLLEEKANKGRLGSCTRDRKLGFLIKAANAYCERRALKRLRYRRADYFPETTAPLRPCIQDDIQLPSVREQNCGR
jgi:hypothetical protein